MKIFLPIIILLISFNTVLGCSYFGDPQPPIEYISAKTSKIFLGKVLSKSVREEKMDGTVFIIQRVKFKVEKAFKGVQDKTIEIVFYEKKRKSSCDEPAPSPEPDEKWMVFDDYDEGVYRRFVRETQWLSFKFNEESHKDVIAGMDKYLQNPATTIYGHTVDDCVLSACVPLKNAEIKIVGEYVKLETKTDQDGKFIFENIPPGKYKITINLPYKAIESFMNWVNSKASVFDNISGKNIFEHETSVGFRDFAYNYFVFHDISKKQ